MGFLLQEGRFFDLTVSFWEKNLYAAYLLGASGSIQ